jgi:hypothetical protein
MRRGSVLFSVSALLMSCTPNIPGYRHERPGCFVPTSVAGMTRIRPSEQQIVAAWSALPFRKDQYIEYWFEDPSGNAQVGISDGAGHWGARLLKVGDSYRSEGADSELDVICIG